MKPGREVADEMRRSMVVEEHSNQYPVERADRRHSAMETMACPPGISPDELYSLVLGKARGIPKSFVDVTRLETWISADYCPARLSRCQQSQKARHGKPQFSEQGLPVAAAGLTVTLLNVMECAPDRNCTRCTTRAGPPRLRRLRRPPGNRVLPKLKLYFLPSQ